MKLARTRNSGIRMVAPVVVPDEPEPPDKDGRPLMTREELKSARRTLDHVRKQLEAWHRVCHTYVGGADSLLLREYEDLQKALDEVERLWRRHGR